MKLLYTNENRILVSNIKNVIEHAGIDVTLKNEFAGGGVGELSTIDSWLELWVVNDEDFQKATEIVDLTLNAEQGYEWFCHKCAEKNDASFDFCWNCHAERKIEDPD